ncbi:MAG: ABC transporter ATP-binding protein [Anaerolineae bacterium]|nr:ABC transporter ATP-binding protein [Anaerolineae bacterium]
MILCDNLVKIYKLADLEMVALQGLDLEVAEGEFVAIVGPSGSGKSTLLNILGGLERPSAGKVLVAERDLATMGALALARYRREDIGFVWQQPARNLIPYLTARENVVLPMSVAGKPDRDVKKYSGELLEAVGLSERAAHRLGQLSGGEQQRVAIAVALANRSRVLLADEPTGELDSHTSRSIMELLQRLNQAYGVTVVLVTHDPQVASQVDRVVTIRDGRTSSEAVRQAAGVNNEGGKSEESPVFEEYAVVDAAGRLQLPKAYLEQLGIRGRAKVELAENAILVQPVAHTGPERRTAPIAAARRRGRGPLGGLWRRWRGK